MSKTNDGGPTFPRPDFNGSWRGPDAFSGMSLRDHLAGLAMQGMLAHSTRYKPRAGAPAHWHHAISQEAYEIADAMLKAREPEACPAYEKIAAAITKSGGPPSCPKCEALEVENLRLRKHVVEAHNKWRHEFAASVDEATDTLFKRLSAIHVIRREGQP